MAEKQSDCWYKYYAINKQNQLVYGFDDVEECRKYCTKENCKMHSRLTLKKHNVNVEDLNNWSDTWNEPED